MAKTAGWYGQFSPDEVLANPERFVLVEPGLSGGRLTAPWNSPEDFIDW